MGLQLTTFPFYRVGTVLALNWKISRKAPDARTATIVRTAQSTAAPLPMDAETRTVLASGPSEAWQGSVSLGTRELLEPRRNCLFPRRSKEPPSELLRCKRR
ncbi:hypothetical protein MRX96_002131 [Rhipicephalus microplus]